MPAEKQIDPKHDEKRKALRGLGAMLVFFGGLLTLAGGASFFSSFGGFEPPRYFWCAFLGLPMLVFGLNLLSAGYMGAIKRYVAGEAAPVAKDTLNYMADETQGSVRTVARAVGEGLAAARTPRASIACPKCDHVNSPDAKFCSQCGGALQQNCRGCGEANEPGAKFCAYCGHSLA
jgi:hypothetical protein